MYKPGQWFPAGGSADCRVATIIKVYRLPFGLFFEYEEGYEIGNGFGDDSYWEFDPDEGGIVDLAEMEEIEARMEKNDQEARAYREANPVDFMGRPLTEKICQGCQSPVMLPEEYGFCESCADKREAGWDLGA